MFGNKRTLEQISSTSTSLVEDLKSLRDRNNDAIEQNVQAMERLANHSNDLRSENLKADRFQ